MNTRINGYMRRDEDGNLSHFVQSLSSMCYARNHNRNEEGSLLGSHQCTDFYTLPEAIEKGYLTGEIVNVSISVIGTVDVAGV